MHNVYVRDIVRFMGGTLLCGEIDSEIRDVSIDSRKILNNGTYFGLKGDRSDGSLYYESAILNGASVLVLSNKYEYNINSDVTVVLVDDTLECLQDLARYKRDLYKIPVIGVTGSVGKTSTKDMIASVLSTEYKVHKTSGNFNNHIGLPLTIMGLCDDDEILVVEMGMNHLGEIDKLTDIARPTIGVITNVGTAHIGNLGSRENILKAKLEIMNSGCKDLVVNVDNDMINSKYLELNSMYYLYTVSIDNDSMYKANNIVKDTFNSSFSINDIGDFNVNVGGDAFIYNSLVAYAIGNILGIDDDNIKKGIANFKLSSHRLERKISKNGINIIDDTYNANASSMINSIELLKNIKNKRRVAILGSMLELGEYSKDMHESLIPYIKDSIDLLVIIGEDIKVIDKCIDECYWFSNYKDSISYLRSELNKDDIVLLKGSHGIELDKLVDEIINFE